MIRILLSAVWLVVVPGALLWLSSRDIVAAMQIDTSNATAAKIQRGMSLAEVEQIIGGPPRDYRIGVPSRIQFVHGNHWPTIYRWESNDGRIEVKDGEHGFGHDPATGGLRSWSTSRGVVDWVIWYPTPEEERGWHPAAAVGGYAAAFFGFAFALYFILWLCAPGGADKTPDPSPPVAPARAD